MMGQTEEHHASALQEKEKKFLLQGLTFAVPFYEDGAFLINALIILICPMWLCDALLTCNESLLI